MHLSDAAVKTTKVLRSWFIQCNTLHRRSVEYVHVDVCSNFDVFTTQKPMGLVSSYLADLCCFYTNSVGWVGDGGSSLVRGKPCFYMFNKKGCHFGRHSGVFGCVPALGVRCDEFWFTSWTSILQKIIWSALPQVLPILPLRACQNLRHFWEAPFRLSRESCDGVSFSPGISMGLCLVMIYIYSWEHA